MAKVHDKFVIELAEVIKGYGNDPDVDDPFHLSEFYRFYELPEIAVSANHFKTMIPLEVEQAKGRKTGRWVWNKNGMDWGIGAWCCSECRIKAATWWATDKGWNPLGCSGGKFCGNCGAYMTDVQDGADHEEVDREE